MSHLIYYKYMTTLGREGHGNVFFHAKLTTTNLEKMKKDLEEKSQSLVNIVIVNIMKLENEND